MKQLYLRLVYSGKILDTFSAKNIVKCNYTRWAHRRPVAIVNEDELFDNENDKEILQEKKTKNITARKTIRSKQKFSQDEKNVIDKISNEKINDVNTEKLTQRIVNLKENDSIITSTMLNVKSRKMRQQNNQILIEGHRLIKDAIVAGVKPHIVFFSRTSDIEDLSLPVESKLYKVPYKSMQLWSNLTTSPGIIGIFDMPDTESTEPASNALPLTIICDNIRDPGNLGSILRTAAGVGCERLILLKGCVDLWDSKVMRSAAGAHFRLPIYTSISEELSFYINDKVDLFLMDNNATNNMNDVFKNFNSRTMYSISKIYENLNFKHTQLPELEEHQSKEIKKSVKMLQSQLPIVPHYAIDFTTNEIVLIVTGETEGLSLESLKQLWGKRVVRINVPLTNDVESLNVGTALGIITFEIQRQIVFKQRE